ncbi:MAG: RHS repeat protein, partial [Actinobacteria bacterium]|nr:RHS repeat protein [Actinomycetota bacterium]
MKQSLSIWTKQHVLRRITWVVLFTFFFSTIGIDLSPLIPTKVGGIPVAEAAVADKDGLGVEDFWNYYSKDLGAGWKYSINTFSGNLVIEKELLNIPGRGAGLSEGLVYNSLSSQDGVLGPGWKLENDLFLQENADGSVTFKDEDGTNHKFTKNADGSYTAPQGVYLKLTKISTTIFTIKDKANSTFRFENGLLTRITDEKSTLNATTFSYTNGRLSQVTDPTGRMLNYTYDPSSGKLISITADPTNRAISFSYENGRLTSVTDPKGAPTRFSYDGSGRISSFTDANNYTTLFFYGADGRVVNVKDRRVRYSYSRQPQEWVAGGTPLNIKGDGIGKWYTLPFNFSFYGKTYNRVYVSTNGILTFNAVPIQTNLQSQTAIAPLRNWQGLVTNQRTGDDIYVFQPDANSIGFRWQAVTRMTHYDTNFEAILYKDGRIRFNYGPQAGDLTPTIGISSGDGLYYHIAYDNNISTTNNMDSIVYTPNVYIPVQCITVAYNLSLLKTMITDPDSRSTVYTHNAAGNLIQLTDGEGVTTTYDWTNNNPIKETDASGSTSSTYDANGNETFISDTLNASTNATTTASYDSLHNPTTVTDPKGNKVTASYDAKSNLLSTVNPTRKEADANTYDTYGNITSATEPGAPTFNILRNGSFEWVYDLLYPQFWFAYGSGVSVDKTVARYGKASAKLTSKTEQTGALFCEPISITPGQKLILSAHAKMEAISGTGGVGISIEYFDPTTGLWHSGTYSNLYKGTGNNTFVVTSVAPSIPNTSNVWVQAVLKKDRAKGTVWFDGAQLESPADDTAGADGHTQTKFDYVENSSFEAGVSYWSHHSASGTIVQSEEPGAAWAGRFGRKISLPTTDTAWIQSVSIPVSPGEPLTLTGFVKTVGLSSLDANSGARVEVEYYDNSNNFKGATVTKLQTGTKDYTRYAVTTTPTTDTAYAVVYGIVRSSAGTTYFDNLKLVPRSTTNYDYDPGANYHTDVTDPLGNKTNYEYDLAGNRTMVKDPKNNTTRFTYDANNNLASVTDALGKVSRYEYDPVSLKMVYRDARSANEADNTYKTSLAYNALNQLISTTDPLGRAVTNSYDASGNLVRTTDPGGRKVLYSYDAAGRLKEKIGSEKYSYTYDPSGNLKQAMKLDYYGNDPTEICSFAYDKANRLTSLTDYFGYTLNLTLDKADNVATVIDSNNKSTSYTYGSANQVLSLTDPSGKNTKFSYDEAGRPLEVARGNGINAIYAYDEVGRIKQIADNGNPDAILAYTYDANGNITQIQGAGGVQSYTYDALNRLTSWTNEAGATTTYEYDAVGNLTKKASKGTRKTFTYNAANEIVDPGIRYNLNGSIFDYKITDSVSIGHGYYLDDNLLLASVWRAEYYVGVTTIANYGYNHKGLRVSKTTPNGTIRYHWDNKDRLV